MGTRIHSYTAPGPTLCILKGRVASYLALAVSSPFTNTKPLRVYILGDLSPRDEESIEEEGSVIKHFPQLPSWCKGPAGSQTQPFISYPRSLSPYRFYVAFSAPTVHTIHRCSGDLHCPLRGDGLEDEAYILVEGKGHKRQSGSNPTLPQTDCVMRGRPLHSSDPTGIFFC